LLGLVRGFPDFEEVLIIMLMMMMMMMLTRISTNNISMKRIL